MGDFYINSTSQDNYIHVYMYSNTTNTDDYDYGSLNNVVDVVTYVTIAVGLPSVLVALCAVFSLVQKHNGAPIYVLNLLISDIIQLCSLIVLQTQKGLIYQTFWYIYYFGLLASVGFMVCVSLERYLVVAWPVWYHFRRTTKISLMVCVVVWALPLVVLLPGFFWVDFEVTEAIFGVFLLLPFPLLIFFLAGTIKALCAASRVPTDEKRRIVALMVLVLLIYTLLFLPSAIWSLAEKPRENDSFSVMSFIIVQFSPFADSLLYVLLRKGAVDKVLVSVCCCRMDNNHVNRSTVLSVS